MTAPRTPAYHYAVHGPDITEAFTVTGGLVVITGLNPCITVTIPEGGTWPGQLALPAPVMATLEAVESRCVPCSTWDAAVTDRDVAAGRALVTASVLRSLSLTDGLGLLAELGYDPCALNQTTVAQLLGSTRETISQLLRTRRAELARTDVSAAVPYA